MGHSHRVIEAALPKGALCVRLDEPRTVISRKVIVAPDLPAGALAVVVEAAGVVLVPDDRLARPSR